MDLPLLKTLQNIKQIENYQSENYQPKTLDLKTLTPKYRNVIIVDQSQDDSAFEVSFFRNPSTEQRLTNGDNHVIERELITNRIDRALAIAMNYSKSPLFIGGWSIVLKEGLYIIGQFHFRRFCSLKIDFEIVGLHEVRLLWQDDVLEYTPMIFSTQASLMTINNIRIYDMRTRKSTPGATIGSNDGSRVTLTNVFIHAPGAVAVDVRDGSSAFFEKCTFTSCWSGINATEKCKVHMEHSCVSNMDHAANFKNNSEFNFSKSRLICAGLVSVNRSKGVINECRIEREGDADIKAAAILVTNEGRLNCNKTMFRGFYQIFRIIGSKTEATINSCVLSNSAVTALVVENGSITISGCVIDCSYSLMYVATNVKGKILITKNKLSESTPRTVYIDNVSKRPEHDFDIEFQLLIYRQDLVPSDKQKSKYTLSVKQNARLEQDFDVMDKLKDKKYKKCAKCWKLEKTDLTTPKFRYCGGCRKVNYCSEACKIAHWADHRLICNGNVRPSNE